jgi:hypothetical protein
MDMRQWLRDQGFTVGSRGRFSPEMIAAWDKAHPDNTYASGKATKTATGRVARIEKAQEKREKKVRRQRVIAGAETNSPETEANSGTLTRVSGVTAPEPFSGPPVRDEKSRTIKVDGFDVAWDTCGQCSQHINYCVCQAGPVAPKYLRQMTGV